LNIPKKSLLIVFSILVGYVLFSVIIYSIPIEEVRDHDQASVILFTNKKDSSLITALEIDSTVIDLIILTEKNVDEKFNENLLKASDVVIIDRFLPENENKILLLKSYINGTNSDLGLIFFGGLKNDKEEDDDFSDLQITLFSDLLPVKLNNDYDVSTDDTSEEDYKIQVAMNNVIEEEKNTNKENAHILVRDIAWTSCPLISKRMITETKSKGTQIIESIDRDHSILSEWDIDEGGTVLLFTLLINGYNNPFVLWPYFNYLIYASVFHVKPEFSDSKIESYAEWPHSPIPHIREIILWFTMIGILWAITFYCFFSMRNKKYPDEIITSSDDSKIELKIQ